jgi:Holliday junction DNA helicase RuvA
MIAQINGTLISKDTDSVVVDVGGVGYELSVPLSTFVLLPNLGDKVSLKVATFIRDDTIELFGFMENREKQLFRLLITVSGVGARLAKNILSGASIDGLISALAKGDALALKALPGVGKKTSERLVLELQDKAHAMGVEPEASAMGASSGGVYEDVVSALKNLGYKGGEVEDAARLLQRELSDDVSFEELLKGTLKGLKKR